MNRRKLNVYASFFQSNLRPFHLNASYPSHIPWFFMKLQCFPACRKCLWGKGIGLVIPFLWRYQPTWKASSTLLSVHNFFSGCLAALPSVWDTASEYWQSICLPSPRLVLLMPMNHLESLGSWKKKYIYIYICIVSALSLSFFYSTVLTLKK